MERPPNGNGDSLRRRIQDQLPPKSGMDCAVTQFRREGEQNRVFLGWKYEAERLFREFWSTGKMSHLGAFVVHIVAMRRRLVARRATFERRNTA
jgi:hypothetical protein